MGRSSGNLANGIVVCVESYNETPKLLTALTTPLGRSADDLPNGVSGVVGHAFDDSVLPTPMDDVQQNLAG